VINQTIALICLQQTPIHQHGDYFNLSLTNDAPVSFLS